MKILHFFLITLFLSCSTSKHTDTGEKSDTKIKYYYGEVILSSPDGTIPYGPSKYSLVKRIIDKNNNTIIEQVFQEKEYFDTKLIRVENSNTFNASDSKNSFNGIIIFKGDSEWNWNAWEYNISMTDNSGKIIGEGNLDLEGIKTEKYFLDSKGNKTVRITENLKSISETEFNKKVPNKL